MLQQPRHRDQLRVRMSGGETSDAWSWSGGEISDVWSHSGGDPGRGEGEGGQEPELPRAQAQQRRDGAPGPLEGER